MDNYPENGCKHFSPGMSKESKCEIWCQSSFTRIPGLSLAEFAHGRPQQNFSTLFTGSTGFLLPVVIFDNVMSHLTCH